MYSIISTYISEKEGVFMALDAPRKVPLPEHGVVKKRMGDKTYIYYATAVYRNEKGQPTADRVPLGGMMTKPAC